MTTPAPSNTEFIKRLREITLANLSDEKFGVNELALSTGMNHFILNRRLRSILKKTTTQFICEIRLEKAKELLEQEELTAAEVAYKVGFSSPAYFNRCFHEFFGYPPGQIKKRGVIEQTDNNNEPSAISKTEEGAPTNLRKQQPISKKFTQKGIVITAAGILILAILSWFYFTPLFKNSDIRLKPEDKSIAVLPFKNLSSEQENQYFADGVMEDILNLLYLIKEFKVVSRTSVEQFRGSAKTVPEIAKKLGVNFILEGSVHRYKDKVRINVQLIDARHDRQILSEKYDREFADIFAIRSDIAKQVADQLQTILSPIKIAQIEKIPTKNPEAYNLYLKGRYFWNRRTKEGIKKSIEYFEKAVQTDPDYALAWAGLGDSYNILATRGWYTPRKEGQAKAILYLRKALKLDKNLVEAHAALGRIHIYTDWNWDEAEKELTLAIRLNPNYAPAHQYYSQLLDVFGYSEKAREQIDLALELDPFSPKMHWHSAELYYNEGNFVESLKELQEALSIEKKDPSIHAKCFFVNYRLGSGDRALDELKEILMLDTLNSKYCNVVNSVYAKSGLTGLIDLGTEIYPKWMDLHAFAGHKEATLKCLEDYLESNAWGGWVQLINKLDCQFLRSEPRFKAIVDKLGLTEYYLKRVKDPGYIKK